MEITHATQASPDVLVNEDLVITGPDFAVVLDGATRASGVEDTGCVHDVAWLVTRLGGSLASRLLADDARLPDLLARSIEDVRSLHARTCDLGNPDSPSSTVAIVRERADAIDYLVLADSPVVVRDRDGMIEVLLDNRNDHLPDYSIESVRALRNATGGFWVASTDPRAAYEAISGTYQRGFVDCVGLFSDGVSRLAERHGMSWSELLGLVEHDGPLAAIDRVRHADRRAAGRLPGKVHDDATAVLCRFDSHPHEARG